MTRVIAIEGGHGAGKDVLMWALMRALGAWPWQHTRNISAMPWESAVEYASQRASLLRECEDELIVSSRWHWSTGVLGRVLCSLGRHDEGVSLIELHGAERRAIGDPLLTLVCDAPEDVLRARVEARGETWGEREAAERAEILRLARLRGWPVLDTTRPRDVVLSEAVGIVREVL